MDAGTIRELERLLADALTNLMVRQLGQSERLRPAQFRQLLRKCRTNYDPALSPWIYRFEPEIHTAGIEDQLLRVLNQELTDFVRDDRIHSATIAISGGRSNGEPVSKVMRNVLVRTIADGPTVAAQAFADCVNNSSCTFYRFFLITGVSIPAPFEVFDGLTLIPLAESVSDLPPYLPFLSTDRDPSRGIGLNDLLGRTAVRVEYEVSPIFQRPSETYTLQSGPDQHFSIKLKGQEVPEPNLNSLCQSLAVVGRCSVQSVMSWSSLLDYEIVDLSSIPGPGAGGHTSTMPHAGLGETVQLGLSQMETIKTLYMGLTQLRTESWEKLRIPIDRWAKAIAEENPLDQIVDLGISFESLYVPDSQGESGFRLANHAAWHLGKDKSDRTELVKEFRQIYAARSDVVHTGRLRGERDRPSFDVSEFVSRAEELCWQGITSIINAGEIPNWSDLSMGEDRNSE